MKIYGYTGTVAAVSSSGKVSAKVPGRAVITARTSNGKTAKCTVTVVPKGTSPNMKGAKYVAVNNRGIRSYTRKDVKSGVTYYVRVRTFNVVNGKRIYSDWSGIKSMRVK